MAAGLPSLDHFQQVQRFFIRGDRLTEIERCASERREELLHRRRELEAISTRIVQLAAEVGEEGSGFRVQGSGTDPIEIFKSLADAAKRQEAAIGASDKIRRQARHILAAQSKHEEAISRLKHRCRELFFEAGVADEQQFRRQALESARADVLRRQREALSKEIDRRNCRTVLGRSDEPTA